MEMSNANQTADATALYTGEMRTVFNKFQDPLIEDQDYQVTSGAKENQHIHGHL